MSELSLAKVIDYGMRVIAVAAVASSTTGCDTRPAVGGMWNERPKDGAEVSGVLYLSADAYPTRDTDPAIESVTFTGHWNGDVSPDPNDPTAWVIFCVDKQAPYECEIDVDEQKNLTPGEDLQLSFDVRNVNGEENLAPNGTITVTVGEPTP